MNSCMSSEEIRSRLSGGKPIVIDRLGGVHHTIPTQINKYIHNVKQIACDIARYPVT